MWHLYLRILHFQLIYGYLKSSITFMAKIFKNTNRSFTEQRGITRISIFKSDKLVAIKPKCYILVVQKLRCNLVLSVENYVIWYEKWYESTAEIYFTLFFLSFDLRLLITLLASSNFSFFFLKATVNIFSHFAFCILVYIIWYSNAIIM